MASSPISVKFGPRLVCLLGASSCARCRMMVDCRCDRQPMRAPPARAVGVHCAPPALLAGDWQDHRGHSCCAERGPGDPGIASAFSAVASVCVNCGWLTPFKPRGSTPSMAGSAKLVGSRAVEDAEACGGLPRSELSADSCPRERRLR